MIILLKDEEKDKNLQIFKNNHLRILNMYKNKSKAARLNGGSQLARRILYFYHRRRITKDNKYSKDLLLKLEKRL